MTAQPPVDALPTQAYASWLRRVGAYLIDYTLFSILAVILGVIGGLIVAVAGGSSRLEGIVDLLLTLAIPVYAIWNWGYRQGATGASIGKSVLKFKVIGETTGQPIGFGLSIVRCFAHFLDGVIFGIGYLLPLFTAKRQTIADMIMDTVCLLDEPPQAVPNRAPRPGVRMAIGIVVLAAAAILTALACLSTTSQWVCTGDHCGFQVAVGPLTYPAWKVFDPYIQSVIVPALWTAGILILRRYSRVTYLLVPFAGIVAIIVFAQGRHAWGWWHNGVAFLACVFVPTAVCVLIARAITRSAAARDQQR